MFLWVISGVPFGIYFCINRAILILQIQPHLFMFFALISFMQALYYPPVSMVRWKIVSIVFLMVAFAVGMEIGFILPLRSLYDRGIKWPDLIFGIVAIILLGAGLLPPYFELAKRKGRVVGINFVFLVIDSMGAWLSMVSVIIGKMDILGIILYAVIAILELGIFLSHFIWCCRFKWFRKGESAELIEEPKKGDKVEEHSVQKTVLTV
ncbi:CPA_1a_G0028110.mRNA.1.CDS.1 [Saccharomyces cerevisiae]|nr:CPA_1a_G0028110.mRNA.1.CDS.1 [Saccharomyces cerevisiae]CAI4526162.1 CPI_1c_G0027500.mRNA.1.CDS.1 [Saccharomyces cerevisiae]CAI4537241.1 BBM_1a_G0027680.mRNA.1.CDS.1 [Saccharomyces cerevisiae]CAI7162425.1 BBM_1a_G0027680.mRNA.1.CDS.1 [Saccharomyces cerevisiae]CAI7343420.1 CPI_1c_G0027500.mRNA.1.CDS.1 [Saccharomyces cerevisiae]